MIVELETTDLTDELLLDIYQEYKSKIIDVQCIIDKMDLENKTAVCKFHKLIYCKLNMGGLKCIGMR